MRMRTVTRPNGEPNMSEHVWGWDAIGVVLVLVLAIVGGITTIKIQLATVETKVDSLRSEFDERIKVAAREHENFVTRSEFDRHTHPVAPGVDSWHR